MHIRLRFKKSEYFTIQYIFITIHEFHYIFDTIHGFIILFHTIQLLAQYEKISSYIYQSKMFTDIV